MKRFFLVAVVLTLCPHAAAANIQDLYDAAKANDPVLGAAGENYLARREVLPQSRSALLPNIVLQGSTSRNRRSFPIGPQLDTFPGSPTFGQLVNIPDQNFNDHSWSAQLRQPVFNAERWFTYSSAKALSSQAEYDLDAAEQNLIVRVAAAYLDVLRAQALLEATQAEEDAVQRQLEQVQQRFDVGLVAITDVLESTAAYDAALVRRIQADGDHDVFFVTLRTITGVAHDAVDRLDSSLPIVNPDPMNEEEWVTAALSTNFTILAAQEALTAAERDLRAKLSGHLLTIDAVVTNSHFVTGGSSFLGGKTDSRSYALQAQMPIFQGGFIRSRYKESRHRVEQSRQNLIERQLTVTRDTRNLFRAVATDVVRVQARSRAIKSSEAALDATQTGYEVGTRNIVDVLLAQQRLFASQFDYADSRYRYVLDLLQLKQTAGTLADPDIAELSAYSDAANPVVRVDSLKGRSP